MLHRPAGRLLPKPRMRRPRRPPRLRLFEASRDRSVRVLRVVAATVHVAAFEVPLQVPTLLQQAPVGRGEMGVRIGRKRVRVY